MANDSKRDAQNALFAAIQSQAENNMKSALRATEKATLLRELAEAYRLVAGGAIPEGTARRRPSSEGTGGDGETPRKRARRPESADESSSEQEQPAEEQEERPRRRGSRRRQQAG